MKNSYLHVFLLVFSLTAYADDIIVDKFGQSVLKSYEEQLNKAKEFRLPYNNKYNPKESVKIIVQLIEQKPDYYRAYYNLGLAYSELNEYSKANESFEKALAIREVNNIKDATVFNSAGWVSMKAQDYAKAELLFKKGIDNKDYNTPRSNRFLYNNIGLLYFYTQRFDESERFLKVARDKYKSKLAQNTLEVIEELKASKLEVLEDKNVSNIVSSPADGWVYFGHLVEETYADTATTDAKTVPTINDIYTVTKKLNVRTAYPQFPLYRMEELKGVYPIGTKVKVLQIKNVGINKIWAKVSKQ